MNAMNMNAMKAVSGAVDRSAGATHRVHRVHLPWALTDALTLAARNLRHVLRNPEELASSTIQPIVFVLLFRYVFGGAIHVGGATSYVNYLMPGIFVQTVALTAMAAGIGLAADLEGGLIDRFRALPMARSAVLAGRALASLARNAAVLVVMLAVGLLIGFRPQGSPRDWLAAGGLLLLFSFALAWVAVALGVLLRSREAVQNVGMTLTFPLTFLSGAFAPTGAMPGPLRVVADHQPLTEVVDAVRGLLLGRPVGDHGWAALAWSLGIVAVVAPLAVAAYRRLTTR